MGEELGQMLCPDADLDTLVKTLEVVDAGRGLADVDRLLRDYGNDPRLHFLKGSLLAAKEDYAGARTAMRHAVDLAPDYVLARFQLGLLLLTCGEPHAAQEAWGPLHGLEPDHYLRLFTTALIHLIHDEWTDALDNFEKGIARNGENPALNHDMQLIVAETRQKMTSADRDEETTSSVHQLLQQSTWHTKH